MLSFEMAAKAQTRLDEEITELAIKLSSLQTQKNKFAPISRLPTPILERIFVYYACDEYYDMNRTYMLYYERVDAHWVGVSHVCRHWRHVALNCPALWSYIFAASPRWTEALLARSLDSPFLRIRANPHTFAMALDFVTQLSVHVERLEECSIHFDCMGLEASTRAVWMLSSRAAPHLRRLVLTQAYRHEHVGTDEAERTRIPFGGDIPCSRELALRNHYTSFYTPTLGGLTIFRLCNLAPAVQLTVAELLVILDRSPDIAKLKLEDALRSGPTSPTCQHRKKLSLPLLSDFRTTASLSETFTLLSCIQLPSAAIVILNCFQKARPCADDFTPFYSFLSQWSGTSASKVVACIPIHTASLGYNYNTMSFSFRTSEYSESGVYTGGSLSLLVDFRPWPPLCEPHVVIDNILRNVPLVHLEDLTVDNCPLPSTVWVDNFWHLSDLRSITIHYRGLVGFLETLSIPSSPPLPNREGPKGRGPRQVFAPCLKRIGLYDLELDDDWEGEETCVSKISRLYHALARRKREAGGPLEELDLIDCSSVCVENVEELLRVVESVNWEGPERESETEE